MKFRKKAIIIILTLVFVVLISGCGVKEKEDNTYPGFASNCSTIDKEDGWFYFFCIQYPKIDKSIKTVKNNYDKSSAYSYVFDGFNIKYKKLDGYYIKISDNSGNEVGQIEPAFPSLSVSETLRDEIKEISEYFNKKAFNKNIALKDIEDLNINTIDKEILVQMFNDAYNKEPIELGSYVDLPQAEIIFSDEVDNYKYNIGYYIEYGNIIKINIDILYNDNTYLSDLIKNNTASKEQIKEYDALKKIEENIIENQSFDISNISNLPATNVNELKEALLKIK